MKPKPAIQIYVLGAVLVVGLVAQLYAAQAAFDMLGRGIVYAVTCALLIEAAAVVEGLVLTISGNGYAIAGLLLTIAVSVVYNYSQAFDAAPDMHPAQLVALAVGPLAALVSIGLTLGNEVRGYFDEVDDWGLGQEAIADDSRRVESRHDRAVKELQLRQMSLDAEARRKMEASAERQRRKLERAAAGVGTKRPKGPAGAAKGPERTIKGQIFAALEKDQDLTGPDLVQMTGCTSRYARKMLQEWKAQVSAEPAQVEPTPAAVAQVPAAVARRRYDPA